MIIEKKEELQKRIDELNRIEKCLTIFYSEKKVEKVLKELLAVFEANDITRPTAPREDFVKYINLLFSI